jgi:glycosyltransferase involved in cell wall biosynthesis
MNINFAIVLNTIGIFGGAERRFTNLFQYLYEKYPNNAYYFVSYDLLNKIKKIYPDYPLKNVIPIGKRKIHANNIKVNNKSVKYGNTDNKTDISFLRKLYRYIKSYITQYALYKEIEKYRKMYNINVFMGVYSGILPLYFYLKKKKRKVKIIFCDMDSWFKDILPKDKKFWYRKYSSFNFALENSDHIDFLSPFILEGIKERGIKIKENLVSITPCSFTDYSKCKIGDKSVFQVAFSGRLEKDKNPILFLEAAINLSSKYPDIIFHIMGDGRLAFEIQEKVKKSGLNNIIYHGFHREPTEILANTSVFVSIQSTNNYPSQSVLEAMACGNAIIATDVGDTRLFINEKNGIFIRLDKSELINAIEKLYFDRDLCRKLRQFAYSYVRENHTVDKMAEYYSELLTIFKQ